MYKAIIFDMDGTILNTIDDITGAVNYILEKYNQPVRTVEEVRYFVGNGLRRTLELSLPDDKTILDDIYEEFAIYYRNHSNIKTKPYEGIVDALKILKNCGYKLAVVSNKRQEAVEILCDKFYKNIFDAIRGDKEGIKRKPDPDMINSVLEELKIDNENAVYVGDSDVDIKTASNSNLDGIFVSWGFRGRKFLADNGAINIVDSPEELVQLIDKLSKC